MDKPSKEVLKSGKVLRLLKNRFLENPNRENIIPLFNCLIDSDLYVPMKANIDPFDEEKFKKAKAGDEIILSNDISLKPDFLLLKENKNILFLPIFSSVSEAGEDYGDYFSWINFSLDQCFELIKNNPKAEGFILDPFSNQMMITKELLDVLEDMLKLTRKVERNK